MLSQSLQLMTRGPMWRWVAVGLGLTLLGTVFLALRTPTTNPWQGLASNLAAEIIGIIVTVLILDRLIAYRKEVEGKQLERSALRELRYPLKRLLWLVARMHRRTTGEVPSFHSYEQFLTPDTARQIASLPLPLKRTGTTEKVPAIETVFDHGREFLKTAKEVTDRYMVHLSLQLFQAIEAVAWAIPQTVPGDRLDEGQAKKLVASLRTLVEVYNRMGDSPISLQEVTGLLK